MLCDCGHPRDETMPEEDDGIAYRATRRTCRACEQISVAAEGAREDAKGKTLHGLKWGVEKVVL